MILQGVNAFANTWGNLVKMRVMYARDEVKEERLVVSNCRSDDAITNDREANVVSVVRTPRLSPYETR